MKIALVGDVMLGRLVNKHLLHADAAYPWGDTLRVLRAADLRVCNLECVVSDVGSPWSLTPKVFHFRTDEKNVAVLKAADIDIATIANNHVLDFEYEALEHMVKVLDAQGILHAGSGANFAAASKAAIASVGDRKIGVLAFTDNEPGWAAGENLPGVWHVPTQVEDPRAQELLARIAALRVETDCVIVSAHWGGNWGYDPPAEHVELAHAMVDAGADIIFGHSPHVFRGIEVYKRRPILYSTGDFIDDYAVDEVERNDESFLFIVDWQAEGRIGVELYPTQIGNFRANLADEGRRGAILGKMERLCGGLGTKLRRLTDHGEIV